MYEIMMQLMHTIGLNGGK